MAEIVLGICSSHGAPLSTAAFPGALEAPVERTKPDLVFRGKTYAFDELAALRRAENLRAQSAPEEHERRMAECTDAISRIADVFDAVKPDVAVILGNDEQELFLDEVVPAITVFSGPTIWEQPISPGHAARRHPELRAAALRYVPPAYTEYPAQPELAGHIIRTAVDGGFDIAASMRLPNHPGHRSGGIGHAFGFVYRQIMRRRVVPNVPIILNTFSPPNRPRAKRCFEFGRAVGRAIRSWPRHLRVAILGSGGMSHSVIDEALDRRVLEALRTRNARALCRIEESDLQAGSSELRTWIAAAGALFETGLPGEVLAYQPCYRCEAGTGIANGFVCWR